MVYCEDCRIKNSLNLPPTYPYVDIIKMECEICHRKKDCYDMPSIYARSRKNWTAEEKALDNLLQQEYHRKADELIIALTTGAYAGAVDHDRTAALQRSLVEVNGQVDWYATYEIRRKLQEAFKRTDDISRNRR